MTPEEQKAALYAAVNHCDSMILQAETDDSRERREARGYSADANRVARYAARRASILIQRRSLESLYESLYGENPWSDVAF